MLLSFFVCADWKIISTYLPFGCISVDWFSGELCPDKNQWPAIQIVDNIATHECSFIRLMFDINHVSLFSLCLVYSECFFLSFCLSHSFQLFPTLLVGIFCGNEWISNFELWAKANFRNEILKKTLTKRAFGNRSNSVRDDFDKRIIVKPANHKVVK